MKMKKIFIIFMTVLFIFSLAGCESSSSPSSSNPNEEYVCSMVKKYRNMLKDPSSLTIYNDVYYFEKDSDIYVFFDASAKNSFGGAVKNGIIYKNGSYLGKYEDHDETGLSADYYLGCAWYLRCKYYNDYTEKISGKTIANKVGCAFLAT